MKKINLTKRLQGGFTLIELLVVVAIIGILAAVILANSSTARNKGINAAVKSNLATARQQGEIFYNTNTATPNSYTDVCTDGVVGGTAGVGAQVLAAAKATRLAGYAINTTGTLTTATCNDSPLAWAAEAPLMTAGLMWCVDSTSISKQTSVSIGAGTSCN